MPDRIVAHCIHHTHWDPFWYFTSQDSMVVFCYDVKEMLRAFDEGRIEDFYLDGQTVAIDEYLTVHPEDEDRIRDLVASDRLIIGPFVSQLDPFISCGESVINNLRLGIAHAEALGKCSRIAYLADPFGHPVDFPKIFNQFGIHEFVLTRGVGDIYGLGNEFHFESNDGSSLLCHVMLAGYGYGTYGFMNRTLFTSEAEDYNRIDVDSLIKRLLERSTLENEFVFPLGFDQNPVMLHIPELIEYYRQKKPDFEFRYTTWRDFFRRVRDRGRNLKTTREELTSPQFHRLHLSGMNSARADIKNILDRAERSLTYETQPLMCMLDSLGIPYDGGIIDKAWYTLVNCQTHASATHIDSTNLWMKENGLAALNYSQAARIHLTRLVAASVEEGTGSCLVVFNTIPWARRLVHEMTVVTRAPTFEILSDGDPLDFTVLSQEHVYAGVVRRDPDDMTEDNWYYRTIIVMDIGLFEGISYRTFEVNETEGSGRVPVQPEVRSKSAPQIANERYTVVCTESGISVTDALTGSTLTDMFYLEDGGDEGDSYDYSYPDEGSELVLTHNFADARVQCIQTAVLGRMKLDGEIRIPASLEERASRRMTATLRYTLTLEVQSGSPVIRVSGDIHNVATEHRVRLGVRTGIRSTFSFAGTHFGYVRRPCDPPEMRNWRENGFFEEPCSSRAVLNHVSAVGDEYSVTVHSRGVKEYQFVGEGFGVIALTLFRSVGFVGLPDLNRRPGRPSGLSNKLLEAPDHQMLGTNEFEFGVELSPEYDANRLMRDYAEFAVDPLYFQNQRLDTTSIPIAYFPMNPVEPPLPRSYRFLKIDGLAGGYSTVCKADHHDGYILRIFNADDTDLPGFELDVGIDCPEPQLVNLAEEERTPSEPTTGPLSTGELRNVLLLKPASE